VSSRGQEQGRRGPPWLRKLLGALLVLGGALLIAACSGKTTGTTNITSTSATLNSVGSCASGESCRWYWEYWPASGPRTAGTKTSINGPVTGPFNNVPLPHDLTGLNPGTQYRWVFCGSGSNSGGGTYYCVGPNGTTSGPTADPPSDSDTFTTIAIQATPGSNQVQVAWSASGVSGLTGYYVQAWIGARPVNARAVGPSTLSATMSGLQGGTPYTFQVSAVTNSGRSPMGTSTAVTPTGSATTYASTVLGDTPGLYYRLNDSMSLAADSSGNGRDGQYNTGHYIQGQGGALVGDADTSTTFNSYCCDYAGYASSLSASGLPIGSASRSVELWFHNDRDGQLLTYGVGGTRALLSLRLVNGNQLAVVTGGDDKYFTAPYAIENSSWHYVVLTYDGSVGLSLYLDGQSLGTQNLAGTLNTGSNNLIVGSNVGGWGTLYAGGLDEVALYPAALSATQVSNHFTQSGNSRPTAPSNVTGTAGANQVMVSWIASTASQGAAVQGYRVQVSKIGVAQNAVWVGGSNTTATFTGLSGGASYTFQVTARNNFGSSLGSVASVAVTPTGSPTTYASTVLSDAPGLYYRLDDSMSSAADSSGNGRDGQYSNNTYGISYSQGQGSALLGDSDASITFNAGRGGSSYAYSPSSAGLPTGSGARTVELWFHNDRDGQLLTYGGAGTRGLFSLRLVNGNQVAVVTGGDDKYFAAPYAIENSSWHHVALSYDGGVGLSLYLDGQSLGTQSLAGPLNTSLSSLIVGSNVDNWGYLFAGGLDEVAIYPSALGLPQVSNHFTQSGNRRPTAPTNVIANVSPNQATVNWTAPTVSPGAPVLAYRVQAFKGGQAQNALWMGSGNTTATITGLSGGSSYTFQVTALNNFGFSPASAPSSPIAETGSATTYVSTVLGDGAALFYRLDDSMNLAADSSGNVRDGQYNTGHYTQGQAGPLVGDSDTSTTFGAICCDYSGYATSSSGAGLPTGSAARTVELWFNTNANGRLLTYGSGGSTRQLFSLRLVNGNQVAVVTSGDDKNFTAPSAIEDSTWHHLAATYDGGVGLTVYLDGQNLGTQTLGAVLNTAVSSLTLGSSDGGIGNTYVGGLDEVAVYGSALSSTQIGNHVSVGDAPLSTPTNVTATAGVNRATVNWSPSTGGIPTQYTITPYSNGTARKTATAPGNSTTANIADLAAGQTYTFTVKASNPSRSTPESAPSNSVTIGASPPVVLPAGAPYLGQYLYVRTQGLGGLAADHYAMVTQANVPAMATWTVEGYLGDQISGCNTGSGRDWGMLGGGTTQPGGAIAGIHMNLGGNPLGSFFVWPGGQYAIPSTGCGTPTAAQGAIPGHFALTYDGATIRGFINGQLLFSQATTSAQIPAAIAGFHDNGSIITASFDELRVSNTARYTASFTPSQTNFAADGSTMLLVHFDDYPIAKMPEVQTSHTSSTVNSIPGVFGDSSGHNNNLTQVWFSTGCVGCAYYPGTIFMPYSLGQGVSADELNGGGLLWMCNCKRSATQYPVNTATGEFWHTIADISVPGRGVALDLSQTYSSRLASNLGRMGYGWSDSYAIKLTFDQGNATIHAGNGAMTTFTFVGNAFIGSPHVQATLVQTGSNYTFTDKSKNVMVFDSTGKLTQQTDRNGYTTALAYNGSSQLTTVTEPAGRTLTFTYYPSGLVQTVADTGGRSVGMQYDGSSNLTQLTDVGGGQWQFGYDSSHLLLTMKDPKCVAGGCTGVVNVYDGSSRVQQQTDPMGRVTKFTYSQFSTTITDPNGNLTIDAYANNVLLSTTRGSGTPQQATLKYSTDVFTLGPTALTDPNGNTTTKTLDPQGNVLSETDPLGRTTNYSYNGFSEPLTVQDPLGVTTTNTYDANGNLKQISRPLMGPGNTVLATKSQTFIYDAAAGRQSDVLQVTDENQKAWTYSYDQYGDRASSTDPLSEKTTYFYDSIGRKTSSVSPNGNATGAIPANYTTAYVPDAFGHDTRVTDPLGHQTNAQYDPNQNQILVTDANLHATNYAFDFDNELTQVTRADTSTIKTTFDSDGNVKTQVDGLNQVTSYGYDALDRKTSMTDPLSRQTTYGYDVSGNLTSALDPKGNTTSMSYDSANELVARSYNDGVTAGVGYSYDADGQRQQMVDGTGTTTYSLDSLHRLTQSTNGANAQVQYGYDLKGQTTSITYPGSTGTVSRTYDDAGRLKTVKDWLTSPSTPFTFNYDANSNLQQTLYPNGVQANWTFDQSNRLMQITDKKGTNTFLDLTYGRDNANQMTAENAQAFGYNTINQATSAGNATYSYDSADRLTQIAVAGGTTSTLPYDAGNQLQSLTQMNGSTQVARYTYAYDPNGNRTSRTDAANAVTPYTYDQGNRLTAYGSSASYKYNGDGTRMAKTLSAVTTQQTWDGVGGMPLIIQDGTTNYVTGPGGLPLEQITSAGVVTYYCQDQLGSTRALTDQTGAVAGTAAFDAYGNATGSTGMATPFQFAGQYLDNESGLYYLRARYYEPATGQFTSRDPAVASTRQPYAYTFDNPLNLTDPSGMCGVALWVLAAPLCAIEAVAQHGDLRGMGSSPVARAAVKAGADFGDFFGQHAVVGFGACFIACFDLKFQGGQLSLSGGGTGFLSKGPYFGAATKPARKRNDNQAFGAGAWCGGGSASIGESDTNGTHLYPDDTEGDILAPPGSYGVGGGSMTTGPKLDLSRLQDFLNQ
jgi:RHS repeat-associated protein